MFCICVELIDQSAIFAFVVAKVYPSLPAFEIMDVVGAVLTVADPSYANIPEYELSVSKYNL